MLTLFIHEMFTFLPWLFGYAVKQLDKKVNFKIFDVTDWITNNSNTHIAQYLICTFYFLKLWLSTMIMNFRFCFPEFQKIYDRLDVSIKERGESFYNDRMPKVVGELKNTGMLFFSHFSLSQFYVSCHSR